MTLTELNKQFSQGEHLSFIHGSGGLPLIQITNNKAQALISLYGAQILAFRPITEQQDLLFLSTKAYYETGKAIRGGIPICWPWFGAHPHDQHLPNHGFARNKLWSVLDTHNESDAITSIKLGIQSSAETLQLWPHDFRLELLITVTDTLSLELITRNTGNSAFTLSQALHAYFRVAAITDINLLGLEQIPYLDKLAHNSTKNQDGAVQVNEEVDRIYDIRDSELVLVDTGFKRQIKCSMSGTDCVVVWNPWQETSLKLEDLNTNDYQNFVCIEAGTVVNKLRIDPGEGYSLKYTIARGN